MVSVGKANIADAEMALVCIGYLFKLLISQQNKNYICNLTDKGIVVIDEV